MVYERLRVEVVGGEAQHVAFCGIVEGVQRAEFFDSALFLHFEKRACHVVVHADDCDLLVIAVLHERNHLLLQKFAGVNLDRELFHLAARNLLVVPRARKLAVGVVDYGKPCVA